jgi:pimeloyl-ACP methyl ester carboxylesterase
VSLVGISAGGSAAINALFARPDKVHKVINICGRLKDGGYLGFRSLEQRSRSSLAFRESVLACEQNLEKIDSTYLSRIMTFRASLGDELVPSDTTLVTGARNIALPTIEHMLSILFALIFYRRCIMNFIEK